MSADENQAPERSPVAGRLPRAVLGLGLVSLLTDIGTEMIFPLLPVFINSTLGAGETFLGLIEGIAETTAALLRLPSGVISDVMPRRKPLLYLGYGLAGLTRPLIGLATAPWHVLTIRFLDRFGKGVRGAPRDAMIADATEPAQRGRAFGFHRAMDHAGAAIGPALAFVFLFFFPGQFRTLFLLAFIPAIAVLAALAFLVPEERRHSGKQGARADWSPRPLGSRFFVMLASLVIFTLGNSSDAFLLLRVTDLGVPTTALPLLWCVFGLSKSAANLIGGRWADRVEPRKLVIAGWIVYALVYSAFGLATTAWQGISLFLGYSVFFGLTEPSERALVAHWAPARLRGTAFGWQSISMGVAALPASLLFGWIWEESGYGAAGAFAMGSALALVAAFVLAMTYLMDPPAHSPAGSGGVK